MPAAKSLGRLPEITTEDNYDRVSAKGYAFGYIGSVILLADLWIVAEGLHLLLRGSPRPQTRVQAS